MENVIYVAYLIFIAELKGLRESLGVGKIYIYWKKIISKNNLLGDQFLIPVSRVVWYVSRKLFEAYEYNKRKFMANTF